MISRARIGRPGTQGLGRTGAWRSWSSWRCHTWRSAWPVWRHRTHRLSAWCRSRSIRRLGRGLHIIARRLGCDGCRRPGRGRGRDRRRTRRRSRARWWGCGWCCSLPGWGRCPARRLALSHHPRSAAQQNQEQRNADRHKDLHAEILISVLSSVSNYGGRPAIRWIL